ncbi:MAG: carbohydrate ABC transporter permease, partial [Rhodococcus sp. (in: high G+C Gram-positive bacteria)]
MSTAVETPKRKAIWWGVNAIVLIYAFIPVLWIISLSVKPDAILNDGSFFPSQYTGEHYEAIFQNDSFTRALINSIGICLISTFIAIVVGTMAA